MRVRIKELDVVMLKDGRQATILEVYEQGKVFLVEIADNRGQTTDTPFIKITDIEKITYTA